MLEETLSSEFIKMLQMCLFVPLLHEQTPKPANIPQDLFGDFLPNISEFREFVERRQEVIHGANLRIQRDIQKLKMK